MKDQQTEKIINDYNANKYQIFHSYQDNGKSVGIISLT